MTDKNKYDGSSIEVLKGLEPVRLRPGMYTDTQNPNHLGMEVIDNSVDEAVAGFATVIGVVAHTDGSLEVSDNGRGMPGCTPAANSTTSSTNSQAACTAWA